MQSTDLATQLISDLEKVNKTLFETIDGFTPEAFNQVPFEGSWTAAEVVEHLRRSDGGLLKMLNGEKQQPGRDPGANLPKMKSSFLNFDVKLKSPETIVPEHREYDKEHLKEAFATRRAAIVDAVQK